MNEQDFVDLAVHLTSLRPAFERFCTRQDFQFVNPLALGRYPRIRIESGKRLNLWFELWMCLDANGDRYEKFFEAVPYELSAGACVHVDGAPRNRFHVVFPIWERMPFFLIRPDRLVTVMEEILPQLQEWDETRLQTYGHRL